MIPLHHDPHYTFRFADDLSTYGFAQIERAVASLFGSTWLPPQS